MLSLPTCSQYRRHAQDPRCRRTYTTWYARVSADPFFSLFLHHFLPFPRSINVQTSLPKIPWLTDRVILFVFSYLWMALLSFKERPPPSATDWSKEILMIEDMGVVRESFLFATGEGGWLRRLVSR